MVILVKFGEPEVLDNGLVTLMEHASSFGTGINTTDGAPSVEILDAIDRLIGTFREAVGPKVGLCLDLNYNFRTEGVLRMISWPVRALIRRWRRA